MTVNSMDQIDAAMSAAREATKREIDAKLKDGLSIATMENGQLVSCQLIETVVSAAVKPRRRRSLSLGARTVLVNTQKESVQAAL